MTPSMRLAAVAVMVVAVAAIILIVVLGDTPGGPPATTQAPQTTTPTTTSTTVTTGTTRSAFDEFFGGSSGPDVVEVRRLRTIEETVARCMADRGFDYQPRRIRAEPETAPDLDEVRRIGFGISTAWTSEGVPTVPGTTTPPTTAPSPEYRIALRGGYLGDGHEADETGCRAWASSNVSERFRPILQAWSSLEPEFAEMEQAIRSDQQVVAAREEWTKCMSEAGFDYERPAQVFSEGVAEIQSRVDEITGGRAVNPNPFAGWSQEEIDAFYRENSPEEVQRYIDAVTDVSVPELDPSQLAPIQEQEIALAVANAECGRIIDRARERVRSTYEEQFIEENRSVLVEIRRLIAGLTRG